MALPPPAAFLLFTPTGERAWADGWDPQFPVAVADETEPGIVFTTAHGGRQTTWVVVRREAGVAITYSRLTPGDRAGLVSVALEPLPTGSTATVVYDLTTLASERNSEVQSFADHFDGFLAGWQDAIARALADAPPSGLRDGS